MQGTMETLFDAAYLSTVTILGILMIRRARGEKQYLLFGIMAVVLGSGDAFHLIPRAYALLTDGLQNHAAALGTGKFITSITMTAFYLLLYYVWRLRYKVEGQQGLTLLFWGLAAARVVLCLLPGNEWQSATPPLSYGILRNIPFAIIGLIIILLFYRSAKEHQDHAFRHMWLTIVLSFAFYLPVVLFADRYPWVGVLMIPKTLAYVWVVWMCWQLYRYMDMTKKQKEAHA